MVLVDSTQHGNKVSVCHALKWDSPVHLFCNHIKLHHVRSQHYQLCRIQNERGRSQCFRMDETLFHASLMWLKILYSVIDLSKISERITTVSTCVYHCLVTLKFIQGFESRGWWLRENRAFLKYLFFLLEAYVWYWFIVLLHSCIETDWQSVNQLTEYHFNRYSMKFISNKKIRMFPRFLVADVADDQRPQIKIQWLSVVHINIK